MKYRVTIASGSLKRSGRTATARSGPGASYFNEWRHKEFDGSRAGQQLTFAQHSKRAFQQMVHPGNRPETRWKQIGRMESFT
ncbi:hypothetical protein PSAB6_60041 [Paraburkholderia sabiae]|nr:hypothetical protein PSAB6_60041 [Paraburkholderia sabiae]